MSNIFKIKFKKTSKTSELLNYITDLLISQKYNLSSEISMLSLIHVLTDSNNSNIYGIYSNCNLELDEDLSFHGIGYGETILITWNEEG